jgi:hypothetical protein
MDEHITTGEFALLLAVFWLPVFLLAAVPQWHLLNARRHRPVWLLAALLLECVLAWGVWASPLYRYFLDLDFLGDFALGSIPLQAAVVAAVASTTLIWILVRRKPRQESAMSASSGPGTRV